MSLTDVVGFPIWTQDKAKGGTTITILSTARTTYGGIDLLEK